MFILRGKVSTLYITDGTLNLLDGLQEKMLATGMASVVSNMAGSVAVSAMVGMYDGEDVQHFGCHVGDRMIIGTFQSVDFQEGDEVHVVASPIDERVSFAHAVVRFSDGLVWMPYAIAKGRWKVARWLFIACIIETLFIASICGIAHLIFDEITWSILLKFSPIQVVLCAFVGGGAFWSSLDDAKYAEEIMWRLGFKRPKSVNLSPFSTARLGVGSSYMTYDLRKALKFYGKRDPL